MHSKLCIAANPNSANSRMIWLPGAYNTIEDFVREGFAQAVSRRAVPLDLEFVDLELRFFNDVGVLQTLRSNLILPLRAAGVSVWLAGISLGGLLALDYAASFEGDLAGICLLAPYPGNRMLIGEISRVAGLDSWDAGELAKTDAERRIWRYLKSRRTDAAPLYLGFGKGDRFAAGLRLMAAALPSAMVDVIDGGHDWRTWTLLWENFLDTGLI